MGQGEVRPPLAHSISHRHVRQHSRLRDDQRHTRSRERATRQRKRAPLVQGLQEFPRHPTDVSAFPSTPRTRPLAGRPPVCTRPCRWFLRSLAQRFRQNSLPQSAHGLDLHLRPHHGPCCRAAQGIAHLRLALGSASVLHSRDASPCRWGRSNCPRAQNVCRGSLPLPLPLTPRHGHRSTKPVRPASQPGPPFPADRPSR